MKILVTGASGFVGKNLINQLSTRHHIFGFSRRKVSNIDYFEGDITNIDQLKNAVSSVEAVVHLAGVIRGSKKAFYTTNVIGARNLSHLAAKYKIKKIVYVSSLAAKGPLEKNEPVSYYGYSKRLAELELLKNSDKYNLIILRPPVIYGPYEQELYKLIKLANVIGVFFAIKDMRLSLIYVEDLVKAISLTLDENNVLSRIYTLCENTPYDIFNIANTIAYHLGKQIKIVKVSKVVLNSIFFSLKYSGIFLDKINEINARLWVCNNSEFRRDFGFEIKNDLFNGIYKTIRWYRENGWL
ncbi:MAG: NAD-dependent epimerase/dehydratase family protein [Desulfurella sp.]|uniref:NAD-dependent epimerase/dehydratase family protein n=1 Tax=Desulfurella sp. TaxID=1962857 RepID=UPI003C8F2F8A